MQRKLISLLLFCLLIVCTANQVMARPSYKQGFARSPAESAHPDRWKGVVGLWVPALGVTGNTLFDQSTSKKHGDLTNMDGTNWVISANPLLPGHALSFNGSDESIDIGTSNALQPKNRITVVATARFSTSQTNKGIFSDWIGGGVDNWFLNTPSGASNKIRFGIRVGDTSFSATSVNTYDDGKWHTYHGIFDGSNVKLLIDGGLTENIVGDATSGPIDSDASDLRIGVYGPSNYFTGDIACVKACNYSFTDAQALEDHLNSLAMFQLRPLIYKAPAAAPSAFIPSISIF